MTGKEEIKRLSAALDHEVGKLKKLPEAKTAGGVSINGFSTWRASRFAVIENGFEGREEDS